MAFRLRHALLSALFGSLLTVGCAVDGVCDVDPADPVCCLDCQADPTRSWCGPNEHNAGTCAEPSCDCTVVPDGGRDGGLDGGPDAMPDGGGDAGPCGMMCPVATPVCDASSGDCVECLGAGDCSAPTAMCDTTSNMCVACLGDGDCTDPTAARCDAGACVPCNDSGQCTGIADGGLCETGVCVECTIADETPCAGNSCDPATNECTATPLGLTIACDPCVADSECLADHRCIPMTYMGAEHGNYCMKVFSTGCARPFVGTALMGRASVSGAAEDDYCPVDESTVSCEAVRALQQSRSCAGGVGDCMADGARCETVGGAPNECTYSCGVNNQCPSGIDCNGYCGG